MGLVHGARRRIACVRTVFVCVAGALGWVVSCVWFKGGECPDTQQGKVSLAHHRAARSSLCVRVRVLTFMLCGPARVAASAQSQCPVPGPRGRGRGASGSSER